jgi:hypothetical protein
VSRKELKELVKMGVLTDAELEDVIAVEFNPVSFCWVWFVYPSLFWCVSLDKVVPCTHLSRTSIPVLDKQSIIISYTLTTLDKQCVIISYPNCG